MKIGIVGPLTWFSGHFPEGWEDDPEICAVDVDEGDYRFLIHLINFRPQITLFYRPELYPKRYIEQISGMKVGFLSEPIPQLVDGGFVGSSETDLRLKVYSSMHWGSFDKIFYYDASKAAAAEKLGWPIAGFRPMPIDLSVFRPA